MKKHLLIGLLLVPAIAASCANNATTRDSASSASVPTAPTVVLDIEGMT